MAICTETNVSRRSKAAMYRLAAKMLEDQALYYGGPVRFACYALELAEFGVPLASGQHSKFCAPMKATFAPGSTNVAWLSTYNSFDGPFDPDGVRILALCFMAAMVETGDA